MHHIAQFTDLECQERQQIDFTMMHNIEELVYDVMRVKSQQIISGYKTAIISWITLCYEPIDIIFLLCRIKNAVCLILECFCHPVSPKSGRNKNKRNNI